jgi:hypothetical protein
MAFIKYKVPALYLFICFYTLFDLSFNHHQEAVHFYIRSYKNRSFRGLFAVGRLQDKIIVVVLWFCANKKKKKHLFSSIS